MKLLLRLEYAALFLLSLYLFSTLVFAWWWYALLFLAPDLGMLGYLQGPKVGAWTYNAVHFFGTAVVLYLIGYHNNDSLFELAGVIILGHASFDRILGYGLKYQDSFKHTHLGNL